MTSVVILSEVSAVAHFELDNGGFLLAEADSVSLVFQDVGIPGPPGSDNDLTGSFSFGDASPVLIGTLQAGIYAPNSRISITNAFDGSGATLSIGSMSNPNLVLGTTQCYPSEVADYDVGCSLLLSVDTNLYLFINPGTSPTQGSGRYWVSIV